MTSDGFHNSVLRSIRAFKPAISHLGSIQTVRPNSAACLRVSEPLHGATAPRIQQYTNPFSRPRILSEPDHFMSASPRIPAPEGSYLHANPKAFPGPILVEKKSPPPPRKRLRSLLGSILPGLISGAANDDPCAVGTYAQAGAAFGFSFLWTAL